MMGGAELGAAPDPASKFVSKVQLPCGGAAELVRSALIRNQETTHAHEVQT